MKCTFVTFVFFADSNDSGASPQGRTRVKMQFGTEEGTGDKSHRLDAMLAWIRETKVRMKEELQASSESATSDKRMRRSLKIKLLSSMPLCYFMLPCNFAR